MTTTFHCWRGIPPSQTRALFNNFLLFVKLFESFPGTSSRQSDPERWYSANIVEGTKNESSWNFCLTEQRRSLSVSSATIRSSVLAGTLLSTYLYTRQWSEVQSERPNEHGSQATFSYRQVQRKHTCIWQASTCSTGFMQHTIHRFEERGGTGHFFSVIHLNARLVETWRSHCNLETHPNRTSSSGVTWPCVSSSQQMESLQWAQHAVLGSSPLLSRFHNNGNAKMTVSKRRCEVCQKNTYFACNKLKSKGGCSLETEAHSAAKHIDRFQVRHVAP